MSSITEVRIEVGATKNIGNFSNVKAAVSVTVSYIRSDQSLTALVQEAGEKARRELGTQITLLEEEYTDEIPY